jgi:hypothetical protein
LYNIRRWTDEEDSLLRSVSTSGKSLTLITAKLKRPMSSIRARAEDLGISIAGTGIGRKKQPR